MGKILFRIKQLSNSDVFLLKLTANEMQNRFYSYAHTGNKVSLGVTDVPKILKL